MAPTAKTSWCNGPADLGSSHARIGAYGRSSGATGLPFVATPRGAMTWRSLMVCSSISVPTPTRRRHATDYEIVKDLHAAGAVGTYDASVVTKDAKGKVHVNKDETSTRHGAWGGAAVGAVVGILFPPSLIAGAAIGAGVGGIGGHIWKGMSRSDVKELGELLDDSEAALLIVGESKLESALEKADMKAEKHVAKELDVSSKDIDEAVKEAATEVS